MTEAPYTADTLIKMVFHRDSDKMIAMRPSDIFMSRNMDSK